MRKLITIIMTLALLLVSGLSYAEDRAETPKETEAKKEAKSEDEIKKEFGYVFPNVPIDSFRESQIPGLYEIVAGTQVIYFSPKGYLVFGEIFTKDGVNITAERRAEVTSKKMKSIPADKAIVVGDGDKKVIEFSDPDCPFCRRAFRYFESRADVKRYVYLFPLKKLHPDAEKKAKYILCSDDPAQAYRDVFSGKMDGKELEIPKECDSVAQRRLDEIQMIGQNLGLTGTPVFYINGKLVRGANIPELEKVLTDIDLEGRNVKK